MTQQGARVIGGRYTLIEVIGRGGMGTVWRARDEVLHREVAVKEIRAPDGSDLVEARRHYDRTMREARAVARLRHNSIVSIIDVLTVQARPWIVMELLKGRTLDDEIKRYGPMEIRRAAAFGLAILDSLCAAHDAGVIHRDVKPANVIITYDGRVVLTDFGVATFTGATTLTQNGEFIGSPAYAAPELARGEAATPATDLWSLGATIYAMVEGRPPYDRPTQMAVVGALLTTEPDRPRRAGELARTLDALLRKDPAKRAGARAVRELLHSAVRDAERATPPSGHRRRPRSQVRRRAILAGLALSLSALAAVAAIDWFPHTSGPSAKPPARHTTTGTTTPAPTTTTGSDESRPAAHLVLVRVTGPSAAITIANTANTRVFYTGVLNHGETRINDSSDLVITVDPAQNVAVVIRGRNVSAGKVGHQSFSP